VTSVDIIITFKKNLKESRLQFIGDSKTPNYFLFEFRVQKLQGFMGVDVQVMNIFKTNMCLLCKNFGLLALDDVC
jgi:hypothetical protein